MEPSFLNSDQPLTSLRPKARDVLQDPYRFQNAVMLQPVSAACDVSTDTEPLMAEQSVPDGRFASSMVLWLICC
jgi:hypothetical protein